MTKVFTVLTIMFFTALPILAVIAPRALGTLPLVLGALGLIFYSVQTKGVHLSKNTIIWIISLLALSGLGILNSPHPDIALNAGIKIWAFTLAGIGLFKGIPLVPQEAKQKVLNTLPWSLACSIVLMLFEHYLNYPIYRLARGLEATDKVATHVLNYAAVLHAIWLFPALYSLRLHKHKIQLRAGLISLTLLSSLLIYSSQAALLGLCLGLVIFGLTYYKATPVIRLIFIGIAVLTLSAPILAPLLYQNQPEFIQGFQTAAVPQRIVIWNASAIEAMESPVTGHGFLATQTRGSSFLEHTTDYPWKRVLHPHNFALQIWIELGLIGILFFLTALFFTYRRLSTSPRALQAYIASTFASIIAIGGVSYSLWQTWWMGTILSIALLIHFIQESKSKN